MTNVPPPLTDREYARKWLHALSEALHGLYVEGSDIYFDATHLTADSTFEATAVGVDGEREEVVRIKVELVRGWRA